MKFLLSEKTKSLSCRKIQLNHQPLELKGNQAVQGALKSQDNSNSTNGCIMTNTISVNDPSLPHFISALQDSNLKVFEKTKSGREVVQHFTHYQFSQFENGSHVAELIKERANFVDQILKKLWQTFIEDPNTSLIAVGGYGRGELHPYSDVDLLIIADDPMQHQEAFSTFITFLWDIGFEVGHSIRSLEDCFQEGLDDVTTATNLLEARWITGSYEPFEQLQQLWSKPDFWPTKTFFKAKKNEQEQRHKRFNETVYQLEPNLKESPGGLRDLHTIYWIAKRYFRVQSIHELVQKKFLTPEEFVQIEAANKYLNRVRFALHHMKKRREDRLLFDNQRLIAETFGYHDNPEKMAVEQFMSGYYRNVQTVVKLNEILMQHFHERLFESDKKSIQNINPRFCLINGYLDIRHPNVFAQNPTALLEVFIVLQALKEAKGLRSNAIRSLRNHLHLINDSFRNDPINKALFLEIFRQPAGINAAVKRMHSYGILGAYLPVFQKISGLMQFNIFHAYTVDDHTILVIRNLRRFFVDHFAYEFPTAHQIAQTICKPEILFIAALFHDIAKGRNGAHEILGAEDTRQFCEQHNLPQKDANLIEWLVRHHLDFSHVAQRKDLSDPKIIKEFAELVDTQARLDHLYLLTVADVCATSDDVWNDWKNSLFLELYNETSNMLQLNEDAPKSKAKKALKTQEVAKATLSKMELKPSQYKTFWESLTESEFFSRQTHADVARLTKILYQHQMGSDNWVQVSPKSSRGASELVIYMNDRDFLFANIAHSLDRQKFDIMEARIFSTTDDKTLVLMYFLDRDTHEIINQDSCDTIESRILEDLIKPLPESPANAYPSYLSRRIRCFETPTQISFHKINKHKTELYISTQDRPGLLARIGLALKQCNIRLHDAKIHTVGEKAEDVFIISDTQDLAIEDKEVQRMLENAIIDLLD
ncbi:[protein-PII] uridylyltransferase [Thiomicrorhabdus indica]|uniref:[protein-PII] uridylyltransferase n=1 Tax=Thiomicrorhabdus indica TaxID=2267253 RepID=UPI001F118EA3|nr:[protein-PII] uridylyltransferase [Thiomicrorhabdus indica]